MAGCNMLLRSQLALQHVASYVQVARALMPVPLEQDESDSSDEQTHHGRHKGRPQQDACRERPALVPQIAAINPDEIALLAAKAYFFCSPNIRFWSGVMQKRNNIPMNTGQPNCR